MFCSKCGKQINDGVSFCPFCGNKINAGKQEETKYTPPPKKNNTTNILVIIVIVILLFGGLGGFGYIRDSISAKIESQRRIDQALMKYQEKMRHL